MGHQNQLTFMDIIPFRKLFAFCLFFPCALAEAQENLSVYNEPGLSVEFDTETSWAYSFGIAHRRIVYLEEEYVFAARNLEFSHVTTYKTKNAGKFGLGIKYKFIELFDENSHDELRITQQYNYSIKHPGIKTGHRFRLEERFEENTSFRVRYRFSAEIPLSGKKTNENGFFLIAETEALLSMEKTSAPEIDQRFGLSVGKSLWENIEIELGLEYQYEDYTHDPEVELFILSGVSISL